MSSYAVSYRILTQSMTACHKPLRWLKKLPPKESRLTQKILTEGTVSAMLCIINMERIHTSSSVNVCAVFRESRPYTRISEFCYRQTLYGYYQISAHVACTYMIQNSQRSSFTDFSCDSVIVNVLSWLTICYHDDYLSNTLNTGKLIERSVLW